ncbi:MAG TPA: hypothetical protein VGF06_12580 [Terriglobales bacterium]|jgi:hypothetical protein
MPRMIDLIRVSAVPAALMHSAAKGALAVPAEEMIEILVYLATKNQVFGQQARFTLAGWDEAASLKVVSNPKAHKSILEYWIAAANLRPALLPSLLENPSVTDGQLLQLAEDASREIAEAMLKSPRVTRTQRVVDALHKNPNLILKKSADPPPAEPPAQAGPAVLAPQESGPAEFEVVPEAPGDSNPVAESDLNDSLQTYLTEHADEIAAEGEKFFQAIGGIYDEIEAKPEAAPEPQPAAPAAAAAPKSAVVAKKTYLSEDEKRGSVLQKIAKLDIKGRIQLAMKGTKEERSILVRDGTKLVALAVLESPKITDGEVEKIASQKNVLEAVLRAIPLKRRFAKHYPVVRNLIFNPRTPLDLSLGLMKNLLVQDLRNLAGNKEVSETIRKLALKMFKQKSDPTKKSM